MEYVPGAPRISEKLLSEVWKRQMVRKEALVTVTSEPVQVIYPGRRNNDRGPDFCDAIIVVGESQPRRGDVELHVRSKDWRIHGHHRDFNYNSVILHVVMWEDDARDTVLQDGRMVPVLPLAKCLDAPLEEVCRRVEVPACSLAPCQNALGRLGAGALGQVLDDAGEKRFRSKAAFFGAELDDIEEPGQVLYEGIMGALGYAKNKHSFRELARRLPLSLIWELIPDGDVQEQHCAIQALLLGVAGLLPSQRQGSFSQGDGEFGDELEYLWHLMNISHGMKESDWCFFRVRPTNFPTRRLAAASYLLTRYRSHGMLEGILGLIREASREAGCMGVEDGFVVAEDGYWARHSDFGIGGVRSPVLIGRERAGEIVVNVILPFFFAWADVYSRLQLKRETLAIYRAYRRLSQNWITCWMVEQLEGKNALNVANTARRQQGLLHLYHTYCTERKCAECPLGIVFERRIAMGKLVVASPAPKPEYSDMLSIN